MKTEAPSGQVLSSTPERTTETILARTTVCTSQRQQQNTR